MTTPSPSPSPSSVPPPVAPVTPPPVRYTSLFRAMNPELFVGAGRKTIGVIGWSGVFAFTMIGGMTAYSQWQSTRGPSHSDEQRRALAILDRKSAMMQQLERNGGLEHFGLSLDRVEDAFRMQRLAIERSTATETKK